MNTPLFIDQTFISKNTNYPKLITQLDKAFGHNLITTPDRNHHNYKSNTNSEDSTLLIMPAWEDQKDLGIKIVTVTSDNPNKGLPTIQGLYVLLNAKTGQPEVLIDAPSLTNKRTAAASALASKYLSRVNSETLLMIGTGSLIPDLVKAHISIRPIRKVFIWGRNYSKAKQVIERLSHLDLEVIAIEDLTETIPKVDIISSATSTINPIILGENIIEGQHIDLVGSFRPNMREADDALIKKAIIYADTKEMAPKESGDLFIPLENGTITMKDIKADLFDLCSGKCEGRNNDQEITLFKSVGLALEDLIAARYYYNIYNSNV